MTTIDRSPIRDYIVIGLLLLNLGFTAYLAFRTVPAGMPAEGEQSRVDISDSEASSLAAEVTKLYNAKDKAALYAKFDSVARAQMTQEQLDTQLDRLYALIGTIGETAFSSAVLAGSDAGRDYYTLNYKVRLLHGQFSSGT